MQAPTHATIPHLLLLWPHWPLSQNPKRIVLSYYCIFISINWDFHPQVFRCFSFPVVFLCFNIFILHIQHHSSTSSSYSVIPVRLERLYLICFLASTKSLRHLLSQGCHLVQAFEFWLDFEVSSNCTKTLVGLSLLHCLILHVPNPCHCILSVFSFSRIVIMLFISLMVFFRGKLNVSLVHLAHHMSLNCILLCICQFSPASSGNDPPKALQFPATQVVYATAQLQPAPSMLYLSFMFC